MANTSRITSSHLLGFCRFGYTVPGLAMVEFHEVEVCSPVSISKKLLGTTRNLRDELSVDYTENWACSGK